MKRLLTSCLLLAAGIVQATEPVPPDTVQPASNRPRYRPGHAQLQTAGGLGMVAGGLGYARLHRRLEADVLLGYVPPRFASTPLTILSLKALYSPWCLSLRPRWELQPLTAGIYVSHTYGLPNAGTKGQYLPGYYWFSRRNRYGPLLGGRLSYRAAPVAATGQPRRLSFYYELGSNDLYLVSYFANRDGLRFGQVLTLALGVKADI